MKKHFSKFIIAGFISLGLIGSAQALDNGGPIDIAVKAKIVGEMANGYLGFVNTPTAAQQNLVRAINEVNARRRAVYTEVAGSTGETVDRVALLQAMRQIQKASIGDFFKDTSGTWCAKSTNSRVEQAADDTIIISCAAANAR